jgi:hypothetical protein
LSDIQADIDFLLSVSRTAPKPGDPSTQSVREALVRVFQLGYNGNRSNYPVEALVLNRGRISPLGLLFDKVADFWYPPREFSKYGRANLPGEAVMYCSAGPATAIVELRPKASDLICMMEGYLDRSPLIAKLIMDVDLYGNLPISDDAKAFERFAATEFSRIAHSPREYLISGGVGSLMFTFGGIEAIIFSSIATNSTGANVALSGSIADKHFQPTKFRAFEVIAAGQWTDIVVRCRATGELEDNRRCIDWELVSECPTHRMSEAFDHS